MSSQCKGTTKSGSPCKITIVLPNGYCRVHQDQYVIEIKQDTKEAERITTEIKPEVIQENVPDKNDDNFDVNNYNSTSYVKNSRSNKRWYVIPVVVFAFLWFIIRLVKKKYK